MHSTPGRAPKALHDKPCPLCGTIYGAKRIWICPACGTALHDETGERKDPLQCLRLCTECPGCRGSLILDGYHHRPQP